MTIRPWKVLESTYIRPRIHVDHCELANGKFLDATILEFGAWANVIALTKENEVVLIRQYRHGVKEILWEIPGGAVEEGEDPAEGAKRELLEETGYTASEFIEVAKLYANPAIQSNNVYSYLALNAEKIDGQHLDDGEDIEVHLIPLAEVTEMVKHGEFSHALMVTTFYSALEWLKSNH